MVLMVSGILKVIVASIAGALIYSIAMLLLLLAGLKPPEPSEVERYILAHNLQVLLFLVLPFAVPFLVSAVFRSGVKLGVIIGLLTILLGSGFFLTEAQLASVGFIGREALYTFTGLTVLYAIPLGLIGGAVGGFISRPPISVLEWVIIRVIAAATAGAVAYNMFWILALVWPALEKVLGNAWWLIYFTRPLVASMIVSLLSRSYIVKLGLTQGLKLIALLAIIGAFTILLSLGFSLPIYLLLELLVGGASTTIFATDPVFSPILILIGAIGMIIAFYVIRKI